MSNSQVVLGIDTSNYKTSVAVVNDEGVVLDTRKFLEVRQGYKGLRQSEALFQHTKNLPDILADSTRYFSDSIDAVAFSSRPRPIADSYMPCFLAGRSAAVSIASAMNVPVMSFSHQEGHLESGVYFSDFELANRFVAFHISGGTCEVLKVSTKYGDTERDLRGCRGFSLLDGENSLYNIELIGGSADISYGQLLDRTGTEMGMAFPCGEELDSIVSAIDKRKISDEKLLTKIKIKDLKINLSGIDTQIKRLVERIDRNTLIYNMFCRISESLIEMILQSAEKTGCSTILLSGGVASSDFLKKNISCSKLLKNLNIVFCDRKYSSDNAVGIAMLGRKYIWG